MRLVWMQSQSKFTEELGNGVPVIPHLVSTVAEQHEIVAVSDVARGSQLFANEMIQWIQKYVGKELTGQIANGQAGRAQTGEKIIPRKWAVLHFFGENSGT